MAATEIQLYCTTAVVSLTKVTNFSYVVIRHWPNEDICHKNFTTDIFICINWRFVYIHLLSFLICWLLLEESQRAESCLLLVTHQCGTNTVIKKQTQTDKSISCHCTTKSKQTMVIWLNMPEWLRPEENTFILSDFKYYKLLTQQH